MVVLALFYVSFSWRKLLAYYLPEASLSLWQKKSVFERLRDIGELPFTLQQISSRAIAKKERQYLEIEFGRKIHEVLWVLPAAMLLHVVSLYALLLSSFGPALEGGSVWSPLATVSSSVHNLFTEYGLSFLGLAFSFSLATYILIRLLREASKYAEHYSNWLGLVSEVRGIKSTEQQNWLKRA